MNNTTCGSNEKRVRTIAFIFLESTFAASIVLLSRFSQLSQVQPWFWVMTAFATMRMAHTISENAPGEWLRTPFTELTDHSSGEGQDVNPRGHGLQHLIGELLSCPICSGTWSALMLTAVYLLSPSVGSVLIFVLSVAGASEIMHFIKQFFEWQGYASRHVTGLYNKANIESARKSTYAANFDTQINKAAREIGLIKMEK